MLVQRHYALPWDLGDERDWMGNTVRPIMQEHVSQVLHAGTMVETREVRETGRFALVMGPAS